jgi:hypothetical protein
MKQKANGQACRGKHQHLQDPKKLTLWNHKRREHLSLALIAGVSFLFKFIQHGWTVYQSYYVKIPMRLHEAVCRQKPKLWANNWFSSWPCSSSTSTFWQVGNFQKFYLQNRLASNDFWLCTKSTLDGMNTSGQCRHSAKFYAALKVIPKLQLHKCFQQWQHQRARCRAQEDHLNCKCIGILMMKSQELNSHTSYTSLTTRKTMSDGQISTHVTHMCHLLFLQYH